MATEADPVIAPTPSDAANGTSIPAREAKAKSQYIVSGPAPYPTNLAQLVYQDTDEAEQWFGNPRLYRLMAKDPAIAGAISVLVDATLAQGFKVLPRVAHDPKEEIDSDPEAVVSAEVAAEFEEALRSLPDAPEVIANEMMTSAFLERSKLAELVWDYPDAGPNVGKLVVVGINPKPRAAWNYVVDAFGKVLGIVPAIPGPEGYAVFPTEKFAILTWAKKDGDPRGTVLIQPCYTPWELRVQLWPQYFKFLKRCAGHRLVGECGPNSFATGVSGALEADSPEEDFAKKLARFDDGTSIGIPNGAKVIPLEPKNDGQAFDRAFSFLRKEIVSVILLAVRATEESKNGSRADSEGAMDVLGNRLRYLRSWVGKWMEGIAFLQTLYNHGPAIARTHAPVVSLGDVDHQDEAALITALSRVGYKLAASQFPEIDARVGLPIREPGEEAVQDPDPADKGDSGPGDDEENDENSEKKQGGGAAKSGSQGKGKGKKSDPPPDDEDEG